MYEVAFRRRQHSNIQINRSSSGWRVITFEYVLTSEIVMDCPGLEKTAAMLIDLVLCANSYVSRPVVPPELVTNCKREGDTVHCTYTKNKMPLVSQHWLVKPLLKPDMYVPMEKSRNCVADSEDSQYRTKQRKLNALACVRGE